MSLGIYGKLPRGERLKRIQASENYRNGSFQNLSLTNAMAEDANFFKVMREFLNKPSNVSPAQPIQALKSDLRRLPERETSLVWFGHSSYLLRTMGKYILVDPVFSGNAAPLSFMVKAFKGADVYDVDDFPEIDLLVLTHDHYDHLDYKTLLRFRPKIKQILCTLGVGSHLEHWGLPANKTVELDWWQAWEMDGMKFSSVPGRHFSGRGVKRGQSLWGGFVMQTKEHRVLIGGDSGYDSHFVKIAERFGPMDLAILEAGQYNKSWPHIHMMPEETVRAALDLQAKRLLPVHWGKFALAMHAWNEPVERVLKEAQQHQLSVITPRIGEPVVFGTWQSSPNWWR